MAHLKTGAVDYIFTDPPFGSNIFYSEMNLFHEACSARSQIARLKLSFIQQETARTAQRIAMKPLLRAAFIEAFRILKPGGHMSVVFGNSSGCIWGLVQRAMRDAGCSAASHVAILEKGQRSVKGLNSASIRLWHILRVLIVRVVS